MLAIRHVGSSGALWELYAVFGTRAVARDENTRGRSHDRYNSTLATHEPTADGHQATHPPGHAVDAAAVAPPIRAFFAG
jgi:hypothetical protein